MNAGIAAAALMIVPARGPSYLIGLCSKEDTGKIKLPERFIKSKHRRKKSEL
jgi:hypothetical protein